jgi:hypothetical protein
LFLTLRQVPPFVQPFFRGMSYFPVRLNLVAWSRHGNPT